MAHDGSGEWIGSPVSDDEWGSLRARALDWTFRTRSGDVRYRWAPGTVMPAEAALIAVDPGWEPEDLWELRDELSNLQVGAHDAAHIHHLRGLFLGQAAEIEGLVIQTAANLGSFKKTPDFGAASKYLCQAARARGDQLASDQAQLAEWFGHIEWVRQRRNELIHATVHVGMGTDPSGDLVPMITLLVPTDPNRPIAPVGHEDDHPVGSWAVALEHGGWCDNPEPTTDQPASPPARPAGTPGPDWAKAPGAAEGLRPPDSDLIYEVELLQDVWRAWRALLSAAQLCHQLVT